MIGGLAEIGYPWQIQRSNQDAASATAVLFFFFSVLSVPLWQIPSSSLPFCDSHSPLPISYFLLCVLRVLCGESSLLGLTHWASSTVTSLLSEFAETMSSFPSPFRSPRAIRKEPLPVS